MFWNLAGGERDSRAAVHAWSPCYSIWFWQVSSNCNFFYYLTDVRCLWWNHQKGQKPECAYKIKLPSHAHDYYSSALGWDRAMWKKSWISIVNEAAVPWAEILRAAEGVPICNLLQALKTHTIHKVFKNWRWITWFALLNACLSSILLLILL